MTESQITKKLIKWFESLSSDDITQRFPDCTPNVKMLSCLPLYAKNNILMYNGVN